MAGCYAIVVAAGRGTRAGGDVPKQYRRVGGRTLLARSAAAFLEHPRIAGVRVVINPDDRALYDEAVSDLRLLEPVAGGATRQESVRNGLRSLAPLSPDLVLVHDAARPFVDGDTISRVIDSLATVPAAIAAVPVVDTLKREDDNGHCDGTVDRTGLWRAQTPQGFRYADIVAAHDAGSGANLTDDAAVAEAAGLSVALVEGTEENFKVTTEADLRRAARMVEAVVDIRTGMGFDVHRFGPGDHVWLCGVQIPHDHGLVGHSDADAGLHALTDAILGTVAAGDIGAHFPPSDPKWKGAASDIFLHQACELVRCAGGTILNLDLTLICEAPRIRPHVETMRARVAEITNLGIARISIKATTTERLGFTGRAEGLAAQAVATVRIGD